MILGIDASRANKEQKTGVEWYAYRVIQELKKNIPQEIEVLLYSDKPLRGELAELPSNWTQKVLCWLPKRLWTQVRLSFEMLIHPPDILFIPAHVFPFIHPKSTVMMVHDVAATKFPKSYNWFERFYSVWAVKVALKKLWRVIVPTEFVRNELIQTFKHLNIKTRANVSVVHHGYDKEYRKIESEGKINEVLKKYGIEKPFIMTIGRLEEKKNTKRIIQAFKLLKDSGQNFQFPISNFQLLLVGKPGHGYEKVQAAINQSTSKKDIITPGWVDEEDIPYLMNAAEVFVFPSLYEGFGLPVLEAMACGTPVVAPSGTSLEEVGGEVPVYVNPENVGEIVDGIKNLLEDNELREDKVSKGLERVKQFSWEKCAKETLEILIAD